MLAKESRLELGGNSGVIVHSDTDLAYAADRCITGSLLTLDSPAFRCSAFWWSIRLRKITELLLAGVGKLKVGDPLDESSDLGPLIRESDAIRAAEWCKSGARRRAPALRRPP